MIIYKVVHYPYGEGSPIMIIGPEVGPRHMQSNGEEATYIRSDGHSAIGEPAQAGVFKVAVSALEEIGRAEAND